MTEVQHQQQQDPQPPVTAASASASSSVSSGAGIPTPSSTGGASAHGGPEPFVFVAGGNGGNAAGYVDGAIIAGGVNEEEFHRRYAAAFGPQAGHAEVVQNAAAAAADGGVSESAPAGEDAPMHDAGAANNDESPPSSGYQDGLNDYPDSLASSIRNGVWEGGLRYHAYKDGLYAFPNDDLEQGRDDTKHDMWMILSDQKLFFAPIEEIMEQGGAEVLDLGTGTGKWAVEMGDRYPNAHEIMGIDLSPIQPAWMPDNVRFAVDNFEDEWVSRENFFDLVHMRHTLHSVRDLPLLLDRIYKHLKPGGYVEFQDMHHWPHCDDGTLTPETPYAVRDWFYYMEQGMRALGSDLHAIIKLPEALRVAGFEDVRVVTMKCPMGPWPRDRRLRYAGLFLRMALEDGLRGLSHRPLGTGLGWKEVQIEMFLLEVRRAIHDNSIHSFWPLHVVYARRPER